MNEVLEFLKKNPVQYFATVGLDGKAKVRPFQFMLENKGKLYFCTNNKKNVYNEMKNNPYVEITISSESAEWIRLSGKIKFSDDIDIKRKIIDDNELVKSLYKNAENPIFEIFYLEEVNAVINDFSGDPPKQYNF